MKFEKREKNANFDLDCSCSTRFAQSLRVKKFFLFVKSSFLTLNVTKLSGTRKTTHRVYRYIALKSKFLKKCTIFDLDDQCSTRFAQSLRVKIFFVLTKSDSLTIKLKKLSGTVKTTDRVRSYSALKLKNAKKTRKKH